MTHRHGQQCGVDCGGRGGQRRKTWDNCNRITIKNDFKNSVDWKIRVSGYERFVTALIYFFPPSKAKITKHFNIIEKMTTEC